MTNRERLDKLRNLAQSRGFDLAWAPANQAWFIVDYCPYAPERAKVRAIKNDMDGITEFLSRWGKPQHGEEDGTGWRWCDHCPGWTFRGLIWRNGVENCPHFKDESNE